MLAHETIRHTCSLNPTEYPLKKHGWASENVVYKASSGSNGHSRTRAEDLGCCILGDLPQTLKVVPLEFGVPL